MHVVSLINMKGGVAKTTLSVNLADILANKHGKKVALIDVDPQFNATQCLMTPVEYRDHLNNKRHTILDVFDSETRASASSVDGSTIKNSIDLEKIELLELERGIFLLPGNLELFRIEMRAADGREFRLKNFIQNNLKKQDFDYIIIDTPPTPSVWMTSALIASDHYLIPVRPDPISITGIDLLKGIVEYRKQNYGLNISCIGLVFTVVERPDSTVYVESRQQLSKDKNWKDQLYSNYLPKRREVASGQLIQKFIIDSKDIDLTRSLMAISNEFRRRIGDND